MWEGDDGMVSAKNAVSLHDAMHVHALEGGQNTMGLLLWVLFGALAGWIASMIVGTDARQGWLANIALGILGAIVGGVLYSALADDSFTINWSIGSFIVALIGGIIVSWGYAMLTNERRRV
jgi:uncharacterized membrane protein YeaQ/YmgE (transglycosylase-associated protein family)